MLPVGSLVYLIGERQKVMILNRKPNVRGKLNLSRFDYTGVIYSEGLQEKEIVSFDRTEIATVLSKGFKSLEDKALFIKFYEEWLSLAVAK